VIKMFCLGFLSCLLMMTGAAGMIYLSLPFKAKMWVAEYNQMEARMSDERVKEIVVGKDFGYLGIPEPIYVRLSPTRIIKVSELTREDAEELGLDASSPMVIEGRVYHFYRQGHTFFSYRDGELEFVKVDQGSSIELAPGPKGPWFCLPIHQDKMIRLFGKPVRWSRRTIFAGYH